MYEDAVDLLQPTVVTSRVCGVCPSALRKLQIPLSNKIYAFFLVLTFAVHQTTIMFNIKRTSGGIVTFIAYLATIGDFTRYTVLVLNAFLSSETLIKFFRIMESAQRSLLALNIRQPPHPTNRSQIVWLLVLFSPKVLSVVCHLFKRSYFPALSGLLHLMVVTGTACLVRVLLSLVHGKLELLNWHLDDLNNRWPIFLPRPPDVSFRDLSCVREWRRSKFILESEDNRTVTAEKIRNFNKAHLKLTYALKTLKTVFSVTLLAYIVPSVIDISLLVPISLRVESFTLSHFQTCSYIAGEICSLCAILSVSSKAQEQV